MKKKIIGLIVGITIVLSFFSVSLSIKRICVKTISDYNISPNISNRIVDIIFDDFQHLNNQQLLNMQSDIKRSASLYKLNSDYFDSSIDYILNNQNITINQNHVDEFYNDIVDIVEKRLNKTLTSKQVISLKKHLKKNINFEQLFKQKIKVLKNRISSKGKLMIRIYRVLHSLLFKVILISGYLILSFLLLENSSSSFFIFLQGISYFISFILDIILINMIQNNSYYLSTHLLGQKVTIDASFLHVLSFIYLAISLVLMIIVYLKTFKDK